MKRILRSCFVLIIVFLLLSLKPDNPAIANNLRAPVQRNVEIEIGECHWNGVRSLTSVTFIVQNTKFTAYGPLNIGPLFNEPSGITFDLRSGTYTYTWFAGYDSTFGVWTNPVTGSFTLNDCFPEASASVSKGVCTWDETNGSVTPVTITLDHASLSLNGVTYTTSTIVNLQPGTYTYSWEGTGGYQGGESNQTLTIPDCTPLPSTVTASQGTCSWSEANGSQTPVNLTIVGAFGTLTKNGSVLGTYNSTNSPVQLNLSPGSYLFNYQPESGYFGSGSLEINLSGCNPTANVSHSIGNCTFNNSQSITTVSFTTTGAVVMVTGPSDDVYHPSLDNPALNLPPGTYDYAWTIMPNYDGQGGSRSFALNSCVPSSVQYDIGGCNWSEVPTGRNVIFSVEGATATLSGDDGSYPPITADYEFINLAGGNYSVDWTPLEGYAGSGNLQFEVPPCVPGLASATVNLKGCGKDANQNDCGEVDILIDNALLVLNGVTYTESSAVTLLPGMYPYTWQALPGFEGEGQGEIDATVCAPKLGAFAEIQVDTCHLIENVSLTDVILILEGSELTLENGDHETFGPYNISQTIKLPPGDYHYSWISLMGYEGTGSGDFTITPCETTERKSSNNDSSAGISDPDSGFELTFDELYAYSSEIDQPAGGLGPSLPSSTLPLAYIPLFGTTLIILIAQRKSPLE